MTDLTVKELSAFKQSLEQDIHDFIEKKLEEAKEKHLAVTRVGVTILTYAQLESPLPKTVVRDVEITIDAGFGKI